MRSKTQTLINALRILSQEIQSEDGVANAAIAEGADRLDELFENNRLLLDSLEWVVKTHVVLEKDDGSGDLFISVPKHNVMSEDERAEYSEECIKTTLKIIKLMYESNKIN